MTISLIAACDLNMAIGYKNELLVKLPNDMKHFRRLTENNFVVMGRKTLDSIGKPLSNRINLILSKNKKYNTPLGCYVYNSIEDLLNEYHNYGEDVEVYICGGSEVYRQFLPFADKVILTLIDHKFPKSDAFFPKLSDEWIPVSRESHKADDKHKYDYHFVTYERNQK